MPNAGKNNTTIAHLFDLLDRWRHLPAYQLERRADIFFALFVPEVLGKHLKVDINPILVPEFPIKKETNNQSKKADYLALSKDGERAFLIELKTDMRSIDEDQIKFLKCTARKGIDEIVEGLKSIAKSESVRRNPQTRGQYFRLFHELEECGLIKIPNRDDLEKLLPSGQCRTPEYEKCIEKVEIGKCPRSLEIVYILPDERAEKIEALKRDIRKIYFKDFSEHAKQQGIIGRRFSKSLDCWKKQAELCLP